MESTWNLVLRMPAEAKGWRVEVLVYNADSELLATDAGNLIGLIAQGELIKSSVVSRPPP
jgi:hypothetical protein